MINYYQKASTKPEIFKQLFCKDLLFVYYDCPLGSNRQDSWSQYNYILYVETGQKIFYSNSRSWLLKSGTAVFVKKGACIIEKVQGEVLCLMAFFIPDDYLVSFLNGNKSLLQNKSNSPKADDLVIPLEVNDMMLAYYQSVMPYFSSTIKPPEDLLELKFKELLFNIISNPVNEELNHFLQALICTQASNMQSIMDANYCYNLRLEDYARLCNRSLSSFKRDFFKLYSDTPAKWLLNKRLTHSRQLLCNTSKSIVDISFESGFENSTHFSHCFKKHFGISPLKYRQQLAEQPS